MPVRLRPALLAALLVAASACADPAVQQAQEAELVDLRTQVAARADADAALEERLATVESLLDDLRLDDGTETRLDDVDEAIGRLTDALETLEAGVETSAAQQAESADALDAATGDLRRSVVDLRGTVDGLRGEVDELRTLYTTLRDRLDRTQR